MYSSFLRNLLFHLDPELSHTLALKGLNFLYRFKFTKDIFPLQSAPREVMGLTFLNPVGLAAGLDKNGDYIDSLAQLGFGFIEVGTITRKPQEGNPKPRLFRLKEHQAIINRMGFNNKGVEYLIQRLKKTKYNGILGINIGKNKDTPIENAVDDYLYLYQQVVPYASYVTVNISSPNTENLRTLQHGDHLSHLLNTLKAEQTRFYHLQNKYVPIVVKIAPDLTRDELAATAEILLSERVDGVIATNTTLSRITVTDSPYANETGGLSGKPLQKRSTQVIEDLHAILKNQIPIIGCGGILSAKDAEEKIRAGAELVQLYTGLIYEGPDLIERCVNRIAEFELHGYK